MFNIHFGQNWDIFWHNGKKMPTEKQYIHMIINKTSVLPRLCARLIGVILELTDVQTKAIVKYTVSLGAAFQI
jgi:geranylgeranyl pyrophosphate synthase